MVQKLEDLELGHVAGYHSSERFPPVPLHRLGTPLNWCLAAGQTSRQLLIADVLVESRPSATPGQDEVFVVPQQPDSITNGMSLFFPFHDSTQKTHEHWCAVLSRRHGRSIGCKLVKPDLSIEGKGIAVVQDTVKSHHNKRDRIVGCHFWLYPTTAMRLADFEHLVAEVASEQCDAGLPLARANAEPCDTIWPDDDDDLALWAAASRYEQRLLHYGPLLGLVLMPI